MSAVTCPGCGAPATQLDDGRLICDDGTDRFELDAVDIANIDATRRMVDAIRAGKPAIDVLKSYADYGFEPR